VGARRGGGGVAWREGKMKGTRNTFPSSPRSRTTPHRALTALLSSNTVSARLPEPGYVTAFLQHAAAFNDVGLSTLLSKDAVLVRLLEPGYVAALLQLAAALGAGRLLDLAGKRPGTLVRLLEHNFVKNIIRINTESGLAAAIASIGVN
jgi:hypothetical protein